MCDQILDGTFDYDTLPNEETKQFVRNLKREPIPPISPDYPISDFIDGLKRWPENTSTSPSGRDLSQYKTILMEFPSDPSVSKKLTELQHCLQLVAIERGQPYDRWCQTLECMLEKVPGNPLSHKLRIICLYEADWNLLIKYFWAKKLVHHCETYQCLGDEQGGSRPGRSAIDVAIRIKSLRSPIQD